MRKLLTATTALAVVLGALPAAKADIVAATPFFVDLGAEGFGDAHRLLTLQQTPEEAGGTVAIGTGQTMITGQAIAGADKSAIGIVGDLGWATGANVGLGLNIDTTGDTVGMNVNSVVLTLYSLNGPSGMHPVQSFALASGIALTGADITEQRGNGNGIFNFTLDATEQAQWTADVVANGGTAGLFVGLNSDMGCTSGSLTCETNDGPDSWLAFNQTAVPLPGALPLMLGGLGLMGGLLYRRRKPNPSVF